MIRRALQVSMSPCSATCRRRLASTAAAFQTRDAAIAVPTNVKESFQVPMTLVDVHLRDEQLPFAYFFEETLDASQLECSLEKVLQSFPVLGGSVNLRRGVIECHPQDSVSLSFTKSDLTMKQWLTESPPHKLHRGGQTRLSPLFDCLRQKHNVNSESSKSNILASVRVTYFAGGGTALGVNLSHALADAASCVRFVQCWGREMQGLGYPNASNARSEATCSGMLSPELLDILDLEEQAGQQQSMLAAFLQHCGWEEEQENDVQIDTRDDTTMKDTHEYVHLKFPPAVLQAMKAHGMAHCEGKETEFVSSNDMVTAFGWLMKRHLSGQSDWNMSMVVNLRGRCGVDNFSTIEDAEGRDGDGVFGNGIMNVVATLPATTPDDDDCNHSPKLQNVSAAAIAIRAALIAGISDIPTRLALSKMGRPVAAPASSTSFASTSWQHFPVYDISFSPDGNLSAFRGHQSHPLPEGDTFSSTIVPNKRGGHTFQLLAPSNKVQAAKSFHKDMCALFLQWYDKHTNKDVRTNVR